MLLPFIELIPQRDKGDCGIAALAMFLGKSYEDVFAKAITKCHPKPHVTGMYTRQLKDVAKRLGVTLSLKRSWDLETDCGLLSVEKIDKKDDEFPQHILLLRFGLLFDTDTTVWEPDAYFAVNSYRPISLLVGPEEN